MRVESIDGGRTVRNRASARGLIYAAAAAATAGFAGTAFGQVNNPIPISNWTTDLVADGAPIASSTNAEFDTANTPYGGGVYYSTSYQTTGGIPLTPFVSATNSNTTFFVADTSPTANESLLLNCVVPTGAAGGNGTGGLSGQAFITSGTVNLSSPGSYTNIAILSAVTNGQAGKNLTVNYTMNFAGGASNSSSFTGADWTASGPYAVNAYNVNRGNTATTTAVGNFGGLLENDLPIPQADQSLALQSITFSMADTATGNDWAWGLFAVSGSVGSSGGFTWSGNIPSGSGSNTATWDTGITPNFTGSVFNSSGTAVFGDTDGNGNQIANPNVLVTAAGVTPFNTIFNNGIFAYNVTGGAIMGSGALTMNGSGTTTLYNTNTYSGGTYVNSGTLIFASGGSDTSSFGTTSFTIGSGGTLTFAAGGEQVTGNVSVFDNGTLNLYNPTRVLSSLTGTGFMTLNGTALAINAGAFTGLTAGTGSVTLNASMPWGGSVPNTYTGGTTINGSSGTQVLIQVGTGQAFGTGPISFSNAALQSSGSTLTVAGGNAFQNNYSFGSVASLTLQGSYSIDLAGNGTLGKGATKFNVSGAALNTVLAGTLSDSPAGASTLIANGPGTLVLSGSNSSYTGGTQVSSGAVIFAGTNPFGGVTTVATGATLQLNTASGLGTSATSSLNVASGGMFTVYDNSGYAGLLGGVQGGAPIPTYVSGTGLNSATGVIVGLNSSTAAYAGNIVVAQGGAGFSGGAFGMLTLSGVISNSPASANPLLDPVLFGRIPSSVTVLSGNSSYTGETQMISDANVSSMSILQIGVNNAVNPASGFTQATVNGNAGGLTLDLHGFNQSFAYISSAFHVNFGSTTSNYSITNNGNSPSVLTISNGSTTLAGTGIGAVGPQTYANVITDGANSLAIVKSGPGFQILTGNNAYSGGTTVAGGTLEAASVTALGTGQGTITMAGGTLFLTVPQALVSTPLLNGFAGFQVNNGSTGGTSVGGASINTASGVATITTAKLSENNSVFSPLKTISTAIGFTASFTYTDVGNLTTPADGVAFVLENDPRGQSAVGADAASLGYGGTTGVGIVKSGAIELSIGPQASVKNYTGFGATNVSTGSVLLNSGDPINVTLFYNASVGTITETLNDTVSGSSNTLVLNGPSGFINFNTLLNGNSAYIGFTGSTYGSNSAASTQQISNFKFGSFSNGTLPLQNPVVTAPNTSSILEVAVSPGVNQQVTGPMTINPASTLTLQANGSNGSRIVLYPQSLTFNTGGGSTYTGKLDIGTNDLDLPNSSLATVTGYVRTAFNYAGGANWSGPGITSLAAASDTTHLTAVGVISNNGNGGPTLYGSGATLGLFDGENPPNSGDILVKYTYFGDANLDGKVDGSDYSLLDAGYASNKPGFNGTVLTGWYNGDFNYDGVIDGSDYTLIDNAFNNQGAREASSMALVASETAQVAPGVAAVPEPASLGLIGVAAAGLFGRRRRA
jgi:fibronectin-binding autotransporter adhesin